MNKVGIELDKLHSRVELELANLRASTRKTRRTIIRAAWPEYDPEVHSMNFEWECPTSPFGYCAYDKNEDPCWDACVFCGEPEERK